MGTRKILAASVILTAAFTTLLLAGCAKEDKRGEKVETSIAESLRHIDKNDEARLDSLAEAIKQKGEKGVREAVSLMHSRDTALAEKAFGVVLELGPIALNPILDSLRTDKPDETVLELGHALDLAQADRGRLASVLDKLMDDKQNVPLPEQPANTEEKLPPRRLCDEAYLMLRRLLSPEETIDDQIMNGRLFLDLSEADRDKEIAKVRKSKRFTPLLEYFPGEEGGASRN